MTVLKRAAAALLATTAIAAFASTASAQEFKGKQAGDIIVRARALAVMPQEKADVNIAATGAKLGTASDDNAYIPEVDLSYFITNNIALELIAGTSRHTVNADTALGHVNVGKVSLLPPTLTAQYHFLPTSRVSPYVGAGINGTLFYREDAAGGVVNINDYKNRFGWALQAGTDVFLTDKILLNFDVKKIFLKTDLTANTSLGIPLKSKVTLDPWLVGVGIGYKF